MKIALLGKKFSPDFNDGIHSLINRLQSEQVELLIHDSFAVHLKKISGLELNYHLFNEDSGIPPDTDFLFSFGGDGTFLETLSYVNRVSVPVLGINTGRLGFLANISKEEISTSMDMLFAGDYSLESRSLIRISREDSPGEIYKPALNEITIHKRNAAMISIHTELDGEYLNSYWADGLIISTPTGSTAYSMSVGGPIMLPESRSFIIAPVSPHNLTVRPLVVPDTKKIKLTVRGRSKDFLVSVDSRSYKIKTGVELCIEKDPGSLRMLKFPTNSFYSTLRNKLMWGMDRRN